MASYIKIVVSLSIVCFISGISLAWLHQSTKEQIELQILENKMMPAVRAVLNEADNDLLQDRGKVEVEGEEVLLFKGAKAGKDYGVALQTFGKGFGGDVGVMIGFNLETDNLVGIAITTMSETPGVGTRAREDKFTKQFKGMGPKNTYKVKADGGDVDAVSGATVTSRAVSAALTQGYKVYLDNKDKIKAAFSKNGQQ